MTAQVTFYTNKQSIAALCSLNTVSLNWTLEQQMHCGVFGPFGSPKLLNGQ